MCHTARRGDHGELLAGQIHVLQERAVLVKPVVELVEVQQVTDLEMRLKPPQYRRRRGVKV